MIPYDDTEEPYRASGEETVEVNDNDLELADRIYEFCDQYTHGLITWEEWKLKTIQATCEAVAPDDVRRFTDWYSHVYEAKVIDEK